MPRRWSSTKALLEQKQSCSNRFNHPRESYMWVGDGIALCMSSRTTAFFDREALLLEERLSLECADRMKNQLYSRSSHAPGPVERTVSMPLRKSGIPVDVDTPAPDQWENMSRSTRNSAACDIPVKTIKCLLSLIHSASLSNLSLSPWGESKCSFFISSSPSPCAMPLIEYCDRCSRSNNWRKNTKSSLFLKFI